MTSVSGTLYGSWSLVYDDESRLTQVTYPSAGGSATDWYWYNALGQRMRETRTGVITDRLCWAGDRLVLVTSDDGSMIYVRDTMESGSYYTPFLATRYGAANRFPLYDGVGTVRALALDSGAVDTSYTLDAFGRPLSAPPVVWDRYRFGGAWGYITERSGMLQLGARFYWPEIGRFIQQDPIGSGVNWYAYAANNPLYWIDPEGFWEFGGEGYAGIGGGLYLGVDPCTGFFLKFKAGVGLGLGGGWLPDFDPHARSRGAEAGFTRGGEGSFFGFDVSAGLAALGYGRGYGIGGGWASDPRGNLRRYPRRPRGPWGLPLYGGGKSGSSYIVSGGVSAALEGGFY